MFKKSVVVTRWLSHNRPAGLRAAVCGRTAAARTRCRHRRREKHHRVAWGNRAVSTACTCPRVSGGGSASCSLAGLNAGDRKWLACSTRGHVLLECGLVAEEDEDDEEVVPGKRITRTSSGRVGGRAGRRRLLFAPQSRRPSPRRPQRARGGAHDASLARPAASWLSRPRR